VMMMGLGRRGSRERSGGEDGDEQEGEHLLHGIVLEFKVADGRASDARVPLP
jgi:hypothetical protein